MANTTNELPETLEQKLDNLTITVNGIWVYLQQELPAMKMALVALEQRVGNLEHRMENFEKRLEAMDDDARARYVDLRKRIDRLDGHFDIVIEEVVDYKKRVRSLEREVADTRLLKT